MHSELNHWRKPPVKKEPIDWIAVAAYVILSLSVGVMAALAL